MDFVNTAKCRVESFPTLTELRAPAAAREGDSPPHSLREAMVRSDPGYQDWKYFKRVLCN